MVSDGKLWFGEPISGAKKHKSNEHQKNLFVSRSSMHEISLRTIYIVTEFKSVYIDNV